MTEARRAQIVTQLGAHWPGLTPAQERLLIQLATPDEMRAIQLAASHTGNQS